MATYRAPGDPPSSGGLLLLWGPVLAWLALWVGLLGWHVDDAGITYAYARNAAAGLGLVPHAGAAPVEGFSNPAWTLLLTAAAALGVALPVASKVLQAVLGAGTLLLVHRVTLLAGGRREEATGVAALTAITTPFVVWTAGGLENALLAFGIVAFLYAVLKGLPGLLVGLLAGMVAITRPEGVLLAAALFLAAEVLVPPGRWHPRRRAAALSFLVLPLAWLTLRLVLFGALLPNPWWAKLGAPLFLRGAQGLLYTATFAAEIALPLLILGWVTAWRVRRLQPMTRASTLLLLAGAGSVLYTGGDWMRHGRLYAHLVPLIALASAPGLLLLFFRPAEVGRPLLRGFGRVVAWSFVVAYAGIQVLFWQAALRAPPFPITIVTEAGRLFAAVGPAACDEPTLSVASPDVGGLLFEHPHARILDLAGLTDAEAARDQGPDHWPARIAAEQPQIVLVHGPWVPRTGLDEGALSTAGYVLLCRRVGTPGPKAERFPPTLWLREDCTTPLPDATREELQAWCARPR